MLITSSCFYPAADIMHYHVVFNGFHDIAWFPSEACFYTMFLKDCRRGESLENSTCLECVVGGKHEQN